MALILNGKQVRDAVATSLKQTIARLPGKPALAIFQVGDRPDSTAYIRQKLLFAEKIGAEVEVLRYPESVLESELLQDIGEYNNDRTIHGIILQLPIPKHLNPRTLIEAIDPKKDVDGLTSYNTKSLYDNNSRGFVPATARGIMSLLSHYDIDVEGKRVTMVGRSALVGKPTAISLLNRNATVTIAHSHTRDLSAVCKGAEILIVAIGKPEFITREYLSKGQVIVDVGINSIQDSEGKTKTVGDIKFSDAEPLASAISPVPGGVGPMTVASLFENLVQAYNQRL